MAELCPFGSDLEGSRLNCVTNKSEGRTCGIYIEGKGCAFKMLAMKALLEAHDDITPWVCSCGKEHIGPIDLCVACGDKKEKPKKVYVLEQLKSLTGDSTIQVFEDEETAYQRFLLVLAQDMDAGNNTFGEGFSFKKASEEREYYIEDYPEHCTWTTRLVTRELV